MCLQSPSLVIPNTGNANPQPSKLLPRDPDLNVIRRLRWWNERNLNIRSSWSKLARSLPVLLLLPDLARRKRIFLSNTSVGEVFFFFCTFLQSFLNFCTNFFFFFTNFWRFLSPMLFFLRAFLLLSTFCAFSHPFLLFLRLFLPPLPPLPPVPIFISSSSASPNCSSSLPARLAPGELIWKEPEVEIIPPRRPTLMEAPTS